MLHLGEIFFEKKKKYLNGRHKLKYGKRCNTFQINESLLNWVFNTTLTNKKVIFVWQIAAKGGSVGQAFGQYHHPIYSNI